MSTPTLRMLLQNMLKPSIFRTADGRNHLATFACIASLFLLWAICNSMIDVMDKHFQELLHLSKAQSAWVQPPIT